MDSHSNSASPSNRMPRKARLITSVLLATLLVLLLRESPAVSGSTGAPSLADQGNPTEPLVIVVNRSNPVDRSEEHTSELQSHLNLVCRLLLEKKKRTASARFSISYTRPSPLDRLAVTHRWARAL